MATPVYSTRSIRNWLLARLPAPDLQRVGKLLQSVDFARRQVTYEPGTAFQYVYFPEAGLISVVNTMHDGSTIEVGTIGHEGMSGLPSLFGIDTAANRHFVQIPGHGWRMSVDDLREETRRDTPLRRLLYGYHIAFLSQTMQSVACNGLHSVQERACRWLLWCLDRSPSPEVMITHEFLAQMLGVRRATVTEVLRPLQQDGLIRYRRGVVFVLDRKRLERITCECYQVIKDEYKRMIPSG